MDIFDSADIKRDEQGNVRQMNHLDEPFRGVEVAAVDAAATPRSVNEVARVSAVRRLADQYLQRAIPRFGMHANLAGEGVVEGAPQSDELVFDEEKALMGNSTVSYSHHIHGLPVWESGVVVQVEESPMQVIGSQSTFHHGLDVRDPGPNDPYRASQLNRDTLARLVGMSAGVEVVVNEKKDFIFQYHSSHRVQTPHANTDAMPFHIPPVANDIEDGAVRVVVAIQFTCKSERGGEQDWLALIDRVSGSVLHVRSLAGCGMQITSESVAGAMAPDAIGEPEISPHDAIDNSDFSVAFFDIGETLGRPIFDGNGDLTEIRIFQDILEIVKELHESSIRVGIISDPGSLDTGLIVSLLQDSGIMDSIERDLVVFGSKDTTAIFVNAATQAGVDPEDCIFVGENASERTVAFDAGFTAVSSPHDVFGVIDPSASVAWVYLRDPATRNGSTAPRPNSGGQRLNRLRELVTLRGLDEPSTGTNQELKGEYIEVRNVELPSPTIPSSRLPGNFRFDVDSNDFGAVNAYHNCDRLFRILEDFGIDVPRYFARSTFPMTVDHRVRFPNRFGVLTANSVNASAPGTREVRPSSDGFRFALAALNTSVGMASAWRVVLHEFGHALLWNHIGWPNFQFAHSAGDALAAIVEDAGNRSLRSETFPWVPISRSHQRSVGDLAWYGPQFEPFISGGGDRAGYVAEQMLSSTMFRVYQAAGGDSTNQIDQKLAASYVTFLIVKAIGMMSFANNPSQPEGFADLLMQADSGEFQFEGQPIRIGLLRKVIRWGFEMQGAYRPQSNPRTNQIGNPPDVDVFVNDGRDGEYYYSTSSNAPDIWNRKADDGGTVNQSAVFGEVNNLFVRVSNRGTTDADNVVVEAYQSDATSGHLWPNDWQPLTTPSIRSSVPIRSGSDVVIGPFKWTPSSTTPSLMVSVNASGDRSNASRFTSSNPIENSRLVPCDNNLAQREITTTIGPTPFA